MPGKEPGGIATGVLSIAVLAEVETVIMEPERATLVVPPVARAVHGSEGEAITETVMEAAVAVAEKETEENGEWHEVVRRVKEQKLMVGVFLEESRRVGWEENFLLLSADEVHRSLLEAPDNRGLLSKTMSDVYGKTVRVRFVQRRPASQPAAGQDAIVSISRSDAGAIDQRATTPETEGELKAPPAKPEPGSSVPSTASRGTQSAKVSPEVEQAMVWFEGEIVKQTESGGPGK